MLVACILVVLLFPVCSGQDRLDCLPWEKEAINASICECRNDLPQQMPCRAGVINVLINRCLTYNESTLYVAECSFIKPLVFDSKSNSIRVPTNLSEINSFFCSPLNRRGLVCSQCKQGYGVSFLTVGLKCAKCSSPLRGWILYLVVQFLPVTLFYILIFMLQISVTSPPMNCFVLYSQFVVLTFNHDQYVMNGIYMESSQLQKMFSILLTLYEPWNLDFGTHLLPDFCVSSSIKNMNILLLRCAPAVYFLILIILTYLVIKLNNFRCRITGVRRCLQRVQLVMSNVRILIKPQASVIDVLATLFFLSCTKFFVSFLLATRTSYLINITAQPPVTLKKTPLIDATYPYLGTQHMIYLTITALMLVPLAAMFLLLACYPFRLFRRALAFTVRSNTKLQYLNMLVEKVHGHYKDGINGTRDLRIFSVFYLVLRAAVILFPHMMHVGSLEYMVRGIILFVSSIIILVVRPYKAKHLSAYDGMLLALLGIQCILMYLKLRTDQFAGYLLWLLAVTMVLPQLALIAYILKVVVRFCDWQMQEEKASRY